MLLFGCVFVLFVLFGAFQCFLVPCILFALFLYVKSYHEKKKKFKTALMTSFILLLKHSESSKTMSFKVINKKILTKVYQSMRKEMFLDEKRTELYCD